LGHRWVWHAFTPVIAPFAASYKNTRYEKITNTHVITLITPVTYPPMTMCAYIHVCVCMYVYVCMCMYVYVCVCMWISCMQISYARMRRVLYRIGPN